MACSHCPLSRPGSNRCSSSPMSCTPVPSALVRTVATSLRQNDGSRSNTYTWAGSLTQTRTLAQVVATLIPIICLHLQASQGVNYAVHAN